MFSIKANHFYFPLSTFNTGFSKVCKIQYWKNQKFHLDTIKKYWQSKLIELVYLSGKLLLFELLQMICVYILYKEFLCNRSKGTVFDHDQGLVANLIVIMGM